MPYPVAPGHPNYSQSGQSQFIPELWSGKILAKFYAATVFGEIANTDYEGEIRAYGDKVIVRTTPDITIRDYAIGQNLVYERPESTPVELLIDKGKYFAFTCDDIVAVQSDLRLMEDWTSDAGEQMKIAIDTAVLAGIYNGAATYNYGNTAGVKTQAYLLGASGAPLQVTKNNVVDLFVDAASILNERNLPSTDRWIVIPDWVSNLIKKSDLKDASMTGDQTSPLRNGRIGSIDYWTIYVSNNIYSVTDSTSVTAYYCPFGHKSALTFASQLTKMETLRAESTFGDLVRGLNVYGYKVMQSANFGMLYLRR